ncbi:MAG: murein biosynthesis integral membrane protein MurJ [Microbacteriaceae bacterium]
MSDQPTPEQPAERGAMRRASAVLASGTLVSRLLGFISAILLSTTIGAVGSGANLFAIANGLPNAIYAIVAGGVLSAVLVPRIVRAGLDADGGAKYINKLVTLGIVIFAVAALIATLAAPWLVQLYAASGDGTGRGLDEQQFALATAFAYWCLPQVFFYALYSLLGEVLNARHVFGPFTWAPALNNIVAIAGIVSFALLYGTDPAHRSVDSWTPQQVALIAGSATLGIAVQALVLFLFWRKAGLRFRPDFRWRGMGLRQTGKTASWIFGMILITQIAGIVQTRVASIAAGSDDDASVAVLRYAWLIFMLPHGIVTFSIATVYFPRMSRHARDGDLNSLRVDLGASLRSNGLLVVFCAIGLMAISFPFARLFTDDFSVVTSMALVLVAYLFGLVPFSMLFLMQRAFYSLEDTKTPFLYQLVQGTIAVLGLLAVAQLPVDRIAIGIAVVVTIAGTVQALISALVLRVRLPGARLLPMIATHVVFTVAMVPAAAVGAGIVTSMGGLSPDGFATSGAIPALLTIGLAGVAMAVVYGALLLLVRNQEMIDFAGPVLRRLRRS